jgi:glycosyltransferase involved in cell wall biosynthesis
MPQAMHIIHVSAYFAPAFRYGGPPRSILGLCKALQQAGVDVEVFTTTANGATDLPASPAEGSRYDKVRVRYFPRAFPRQFYGTRGMATALRAALRPCDLLHIHGLWNLPAWMAARLARRANVPYILSPRGMLSAASLAYRAWRKRVAYHLVERKNLANAALVHATCVGEAQTLSHRSLGDRVFVLPNGVDIPEGPSPHADAFRQRLGVAATAPLVVFVGRIHPIKRLDLLTAAFARVRASQPDAHLVIAGLDEAGYRAQIESQGDPLQVHWLGELGPGDHAALLTKASMLVMCSDSESFGMSIVEALAAGVPVVVTRTCPWGEIMTVGCGLLVEQHVDALAEGIGWLLANPAVARVMGERGQAWVKQRYSWEALARTMIEHYTRAVRSPSRAINVR